ncbi:MAG TPA: hypothetical protein VFJ85_10645 [Acidimicrobiales bacterium]|nr:hypothetical protein [Acidimicrobiales bacterium]
MEPLSGARLATIHFLPTPPARSRSRHRRLQVVAGVTLAVAVIAAGLFVDSWMKFRPHLVAGGVVGYQGPEIRTIAPPGGDQASVVRFHRREPFSMVFTFTNDSSRPVEILGFPGPTDFGTFTRVGVFLGPKAYRPSWTVPMTPFTPFRLGPHQSRLLELRYAFADCSITPPPVADRAQFGWGLVLERAAVRYRATGHTREQSFELPEALGLEGTGGDCPG